MSTGNADPLKEELPEITELIMRDRAVRFADGSIRSNIDAIVFCTGYSYSYPFLSTLKPQVTSNGLRAEHVYQHIFYTPHPTLAFLALPQRVVPFIISEAQSAAAARVWANRIQLPSSEEMVRWEHELIAELGPGKMFHAMNFPKDVDYVNELYDWSMTASPSGMGKDPPRWGGTERWVRERCAAMRAAFVALGSTRHRVHTLKDLGFDPGEALIPQIESRSVL